MLSTRYESRGGAFVGAAFFVPMAGESTKKRPGVVDRFSLLARGLGYLDALCRAIGEVYAENALNH